MTAPAIVIRLELERRPALYADIASEGEEARLLKWVAAHPGYRELILRALELAGEELAA